MNKKLSKIEIPVLVVFFARPEQLFKVFEQIKLARPSKLYLYQDGARNNRPDDIDNIMKCRKIVEDIDWNCEVHKKYQLKNIGCWPSTFTAQRWMFENEDYGIVLEDDCVPSQSFFPFCKELLERYEHDERINMICGMNHLGESNGNPYSYFFTTSGSIWGWASWKRVIDMWDERYEFLNDSNALNLLKNKLEPRFYKQFYENSLNHKNSGNAYFETIMAACMFLNSSLNIVPTKNMVSNIGVGGNTTHSVDSINKLPRGIRQVFFMKTYDLDIDSTLKHPKYITEDITYKKKVNRIMGDGYPLVQFYRKIESILYRVLLGDSSSIIKGFKKKISLK